jgi:integrase
MDDAAPRAFDSDLEGRNVYSARDSILGDRSLKKTRRRSVLKGGFPHALFHDLRYTVGSKLIQAGSHVAQVRTMLVHQMVNTMMDAPQLGGQENVEAVDLFNRPI